MRRDVESLIVGPVFGAALAVAQGINKAALILLLRAMGSDAEYEGTLTST